MSVTYYLRIKKEYAAALIEDLQKVDAIEVIQEQDTADIEIMEWQKESVLARLNEAKENPETLISWIDAKQRLEAFIQ